MESATEAYARNLADVRALLAKISGGLDDHVADQAADPENWGFGGDLAYVREQLTRAADFLAANHAGCSES